MELYRECGRLSDITTEPDQRNGCGIRCTESVSAAVLMLVGTVVSLAIPDIILSMFQADAELMRAGMEALRLISLGFLVSSAGVIFSGVFEALDGVEIL